MEENKCTCKTCGKLKVRKLVGVFGKNNKKYVDEHNLVWNGRKYCGVCNLDRIRTHMDKLRKQRKEVSNAVAPRTEA